MIQRVKQIAMERESQSAGNLAPAKDVGTESEVRHARMPDGVSRDISSIRIDFPILARIMPNGKSLVYLDNAASSHRPIPVLERMEKVQRHSYSNAHRSGHQLASETTMAMEEAREGIRSFLNARDKAEVIFTSGTTASINMVARAWGDAFVSPGDEILLSEMEHHSNIVPWQQLAERVGAKIRWIPLQDDYRLSLDHLSNLLTSKTKLVAVTAVSNVLGTINPIRAIADRVHAVGAKLLVDAAQAVPHGALDVQHWDADFVAFGAHKMLGPTGIGVLYGKKSLLESMPPFFGGGGMIHQVTHDGFTPAELPYRLEAGTPAAVEAIGMLPAIDYLRSLGGGAILQWERTLVKRAEDGLASLKGLRIYGPPSEQRTGLLTFTIDGLHPEDIGRWLDAEGIAIRAGHHCAMPLHARLGLKAPAAHRSIATTPRRMSIASSSRSTKSIDVLLGRCRLEGRLALFSALHVQ